MASTRGHRQSQHVVVSASELAQVGVCEKRVVFEHRHGKRRTVAQQRDIQRGLRAHQRFYRERHLDSGGRGRCFVATQAFGPQASETATLRRFRDQVLRPWWIGRWLIRCYYRIAPAICDRIEHRPVVRRAVHCALVPIVCCAALWMSGSRERP